MKATDLILRFTVMLTLLLIGFAVMFHVEYGVISEDFGTLSTSIFTMFKFTLGVFDETLKVMLDKNRPFTFVFFLLFLILFTFILINMYLATMMVTYAQTASA